MEDAAAREFLEETGASVDRASLTHAAVLDFYFPHTQDESGTSECTCSWPRGTPALPHRRTNLPRMVRTWRTAARSHVGRCADLAAARIEGHRLGAEFLFDANLKVVEHEFRRCGIQRQLTRSRACLLRRGGSCPTIAVTP